MSGAVADVKLIFGTAQDIDSPAQRSAFLDEACGQDTALRAEVERLLAAGELAGSFMQEPVLGSRTAIYKQIEEGPGTVIGQYKLMEQIGEGGFGLVFVAEQHQPVRRKVALKVIKPGMDTRDVIARFEAERQALALMDHPNIAKVFDAGATDSGRPYFVMELVRGIPITEYCDQQHLTPRERLELFVSLCHAIQHAHQKGIIHRDVKPTNVLVTEHDGRPVVKVIDFGVAKALSQQLTQHTIYTQFAQMIGTPLYMSPEQAAMSGLDIDTRSDIYSLGVLLYELLTGSTPFDRKRLNQAAADEIRRIIREEEPPKPSTRLSQSGDRLPSIAALRNTEAAGLSKLVRGELDWIVMTCLEKDRNCRYETASGLARDVEHYLHDEPVAACPPSATYRFRKFARRNKVVLATGAVVATVLVLGTVISTWQAVRATRAERQVVRERDQVLAEKQQKETALIQKQEALAEAKRNERIAQERLATGLIAAGDAALALGRADARDSYWEAGEVAKRLGLSELPAKTGLLASYADQPPPLMGNDGLRSGIGGFEGHSRGRLTLAFSPDGRSVIAASTDGTLRLWDVVTGRSIRSFPGNEEGFYSVAFSPDGRTVLTGGRDSTLRLWDVASGKLLRTLSGHRGDVRSVAFSPDGQRAVSGSSDRTVRLWDVPSGHELRSFEAPSYVANVAFSPDGRQVLAGGEPDAITLWDVASGQQIQEISDGSGSAVVSVAFSPDGRTALSGSLGKGMILWDLETGKAIRTFRGHSTSVLHVAFSPDGRLALSTSSDKTVRLWDTTTAQQIDVWRGHRDEVGSGEFSPDGRFAISGDYGGAIKFWDLQKDKDIPAYRGHTARIIALAAGPDGRTVLSGSFDKSIRLWDVATGLPIRTIVTGDSPVWGVALSRDGRTALSAYYDGTLAMWDMRTGSRLRNLVGHDDVVTAAAFSPDGRTALSASSDQTLKLWNLDTGEAIRTFTGHSYKVRAVAFSSDGRTTLSGSFDNTIKLWDVSTGKVLQTLTGHRHWVHSIAFSPDGRTAASGSWDHSFGLWDLATGKNLYIQQASPDVVTGVAFSPDGKLLFCGSLDGSVGLWDLTKRQHVRNLSRHNDGVTCVTYCANGETALSGSRDGLVRRWEWDRTVRYAEFAASLSAARKALILDPNDADALAVFGRWYAFRGVYDWAADFFEQAKEAGGEVSSLELARCYWQLDRRSDAAHEFRRAIERKEAPVDYLTLCLDAIDGAGLKP